MSIYSKSYLEHLEWREKIRLLGLKAREEVEGVKLYGHEINLSKPEEVIATLYILYKEYNAFHENF